MGTTLLIGFCIWLVSCIIAAICGVDGVAGYVISQICYALFILLIGGLFSIGVVYVLAE